MELERDIFLYFKGTMSHSCAIHPPTALPPSHAPRRSPAYHPEPLTTAAFILCFRLALVCVFFPSYHPFLRGAGGEAYSRGIRPKLQKLLSGEPGVVFSEPDASTCDRDCYRKELRRAHERRGVQAEDRQALVCVAAGCPGL